MVVGSNFSIIIDNGKIYSFGENKYKQLGLDHSIDQYTPTLVNFQFDGDPIKAQQGNEHLLILTDNNKLYKFGKSIYDIFGVEYYYNEIIDPLIDFPFDGNIIDISQGFNYSLILTDTNKIYSFGINEFGQLGHGDYNAREFPELIDFQFNGNPIKIQQGFNHSLILTDNNVVYGFGENLYGQLQYENMSIEYEPALINFQFDGNPIKIQQGNQYSLILTDTGKVYSFGKNNYGQLGLGNNSPQYEPTLIDFQFDGIPVNIQQGKEHSMILTNTNKVYSFGYNKYGQLGLGDYNNRNIPTLINFQFNGNPVDINLGDNHSMIITNTNNIYMVGSNVCGQLGTNEPSTNIFVKVWEIGNKYNLTISQNPIDKGTIKVNNQTVIVPYSNEFNPNEQINIKQIPNDKYEFVRWHEL